MLILVGETLKLRINARLKSRKPIVISRQEVCCLVESHQSHSVPGRYLEGTDLVSFLFFLHPADTRMISWTVSDSPLELKNM